jgi:hypothetical protein
MINMGVGHNREVGWKWSDVPFRLLYFRGRNPTNDFHLSFGRITRGHRRLGWFSGLAEEPARCREAGPDRERRPGSHRNGTNKRVFMSADRRRPRCRRLTDSN